MIPSQLLFLSFILIVLVLLVLLALDIDYLSRLFSREESSLFTERTPQEKDVEDINQQINLNVVSESVGEKLIQICPVNAITKSSDPEERMIISKTLCLGYICRECLRLVLLFRYQGEICE